MTVRAMATVILATLALGIAVGGGIAWWAASGRIESANLRAERAAALVIEQSAAIDALKTEADKRAAAAAEALKKAESARRTAERRAQELLARQPPPGVDACTAASALIREELGR